MHSGYVIKTNYPNAMQNYVSQIIHAWDGAVFWPIMPWNNECLYNHYCSLHFEENQVAAMVARSEGAHKCTVINT